LRGDLGAIRNSRNSIIILYTADSPRRWSWQYNISMDNSAMLCRIGYGGGTKIVVYDYNMYTPSRQRAPCRRRSRRHRVREPTRERSFCGPTKRVCGGRSSSTCTSTRAPPRRSHPVVVVHRETTVVVAVAAAAVARTSEN